MNTDDPTVPPPSTFDFMDFARMIYADPDKPAVAEQEKYILPALYGGDLGGGGGSNKFKALVVMQNPLFTITKQLWKECTTPEQAVKRHREVFFQWWRRKSNPELAELFRIFVDKPSTAEEFFRRVYVTDIWKDAKDTHDANSRKKTATMDVTGDQSSRSRLRALPLPPSA
jgi:hypothetical protein